MSYFNYQSKKIYYKETGSGKPIVFLHGNTASSRMFELILPLYEDKFHVILIDFLGHGKSDRLEEFPAELWTEEARQTTALLEHLDIGKVNLVGTSGGAWAAVNAALEQPYLVDKVVADSFDGRTLADDFSENLLKERAEAKKDEMGRAFYEWCQGDDWERIVDMDTNAMVQCAKEKLPLFTKPLSALENHLCSWAVREMTCAEQIFRMNIVSLPERQMQTYVYSRKGYILQSSPVRRRLQRPFRDSWKNKNHKEAGR